MASPSTPVGNYTGSFWDLLNPYALLGGVVTLLLCLAQGSSFLQLRTLDADQGSRGSPRLGSWLPLAAVVVIGFVLWTFSEVSHHSPGFWITDRSSRSSRSSRPPSLVRALDASGCAFIAGGLGIAMTVATWFTALYPNVIVDSNNHANNLTIWNASSNHYTLVVMTVTALILVPIVLIYQIWTYYVFRKTRRPGRIFRPDRARGPGSPAGGKHPRV